LSLVVILKVSFLFPQPIAPNPLIPESQAIYDEHIKVLKQNRQN